MSNIKSFDEIKHMGEAEQAIKNVDIALNDFPSWLVFCTGSKGGFVAMYSPTLDYEHQLKRQIIRSLQAQPALTSFLKQILSEI